MKLLNAIAWATGATKRTVTKKVTTNSRSLYLHYQAGKRGWSNPTEATNIDDWAKSRGMIKS